MTVSRIFPCLQWAREYHRGTLANDLMAAVIVTVMLIPQSLAYAILAGLPAQVGLYASILPLVAYAIFGTSRTLSVGPVAVASLMTASAVQDMSAADIDPLAAATLLAFLSGTFLILIGFLRLGFLANVLSHPVVSGFITASGILIALSQVRHILGIDAGGDTLPELLRTLSNNLGDINLPTLAVGGVALAFLFWSRSGMVALLVKTGLSLNTARLLGRAAPVVVVFATGLAAWWWKLGEAGLALVGEVPSGLPSIQLPPLDPELLRQLLIPAVLISIIGYVESVSVGKTLGAKRRQKIDPDQELVGLGAANVASAVSGGFPVTGGFSRSVVNFDAGAETPAAGLFTAVGISLAALYLTDLLAWLPNATLGAIIIVAVLGLVDFSILKRTWRFSYSDFFAVSATLLVTLLAGVEMGVLCGVVVSIALHLFKTSRPHIAEVGEIEGTEHFRNVKRHKVRTWPGIISLRVDESLYFPNASFLEDEIFRNLADRKDLKHVVLMCTAVNEIDLSALEVLENVNDRLRELNIGFHLSEVKGPVMDALERTDFLKHLNGKVFLSQHMAVQNIVAQENQDNDVHEAL